MVESNATGLFLVYPKTVIYTDLLINFNNLKKKIITVACIQIIERANYKSNKYRIFMENRSMLKT